MPPTRVIIEADGGSRGNPGPAAYGAALRDADTGHVIAERAEAIGVATNNVAEYRGLIAGLELLREHAPDAAEVEVRMDSKLVVEQMAGRWKVKHPDMRPLAIEANRLAPFGVTWTWVPRAENAHADRLLNDVLDEATGRPSKPARRTAKAEEAAPAQPVGFASDLGEPTRLILLRHGQTEHTVGRRFSGAGGIDPSIDDTGRAQATAAADWLKSRGDVAAVLTSPLARTRQTAQIVAEALGVTAETEDGLRETDFGAWEGHTFAEVQHQWPKELDAWLASTATAPPEGESFDDVAVRVRRTRDRVVRLHPGRTVVAVTHGTPIKVLVCAALQAPVSSVFRMEVGVGSLSIVEWYADGGTALRAFSLPSGG